MTPEQFDEIINAITAGETVRSAIVAAGVSGRAFYARLNADDSATERYARAKEAQIEAMADDMLNIADTAGEPLRNDDGEVILRDDKPIMCVTNEAVSAAKLKVETRKWLLSKLAPKKYGDKIDVNANVQGGFAINVLPPIVGGVG